MQQVLTRGLSDGSLPGLGLLEDSVHFLRVQAVRGAAKHREERAQRRVQDHSDRSSNKQNKKSQKHYMQYATNEGDALTSTMTVCTYDVNKSVEKINQKSEQLVAGAWGGSRTCTRQKFSDMSVAVSPRLLNTK